MATKKTQVPDIGRLLELPKTEIQHVQPVMPQKTSSGVPSPKGKMGRPSNKVEGIEYVKIGPKIPASLKMKIDLALVQRQFTDGDGNPIKSIEELTILAFVTLFASR